MDLIVVSTYLHRTWLNWATPSPHRVNEVRFLYRTWFGSSFITSGISNDGDPPVVIQCIVKPAGLSGVRKSRSRQHSLENLGETPGWLFSKIRLVPIEVGVSPSLPPFHRLKIRALLGGLFFKSGATAWFDWQSVLVVSPIYQWTKNLFFVIRALSENLH